MSRQAILLTIKQFASFTGVGAVGTAAHYSVLIGLVNLLQFSPIASSGLGFTVGAFVNYSLNYRLTFQSTKMHRESLPKFFIVGIAGLALNTAIMTLLTQVLTLHYLLAQVVATATVLIWNFVGNRCWTFR